MSLSVQFLSLLAMIGTGIVAGAFMDMIGTGTAYAGKKSIIRKYAVVLEVIGWIVVGCGTFYILYLVRDGAWRIYDPFAQISGMLLYASFFHKPFRFLGRILFILFVKPLWFIVHLLVSIDHLSGLSGYCESHCSSYSRHLLNYSIHIPRKLFKRRWEMIYNLWTISELSNV